MRLRVSAALALVGLAAGAPAQTVRERVDIQVLSLRVAATTRDGRPVTNLEKEDLLLTVDDRPVAIDTLSLSGTTVPADPAVPREIQAPGPVRTLVFADEGETHFADRAVVYRDLERFLRESASAQREVMIARFDGGGLEVPLPWTSDVNRAVETLRRLREKPAANLLPTAEDVGASSVRWIELYREHLHAALLEALASFPDTRGAKQLLVVSGGTALLRPADLVSILRCELTEAQRSRLQQTNPDVSAAHAKEIERATFALWTRAVHPAGDVLTMSDVLAKAVERDVAVIPVSAEAIQRRALGDVAWKSMSTVSAGDRRLPPRLSAGQVMTEMAQSTGSEPILVPGKTAARLAELETRPVYTLTFRDTAGDNRYHRVVLTARRPDVTLAHRRGYRLAGEDERALDGVVARFQGTSAADNPLEARATLSPASPYDVRTTRIDLRITPPRESAPSAQRTLLCIAMGRGADGERTEPVTWTATAEAEADGSGAYAATSVLKAPIGGYTWSVAIRDVDTGLTSFLLLRPAE